MTSPKTPVYFFSHGGPNLMFTPDHPAYKKLEEIGLEITQQVRPKAVVVFSAHWQSDSDIIEVNNVKESDLIYDFYNFPAEYYKVKYPHEGDPQIASKVVEALKAVGVKAQTTNRGLDHGVFVPFRVAFHPDRNPLNVPIIQVSLFANEDPAAHYALGRALTSLRTQGILIIVSGMAVHNLRDMRIYGLSEPRPSAVSFDKALKEAVEMDPKEREEKMCQLLQRSDARGAHPTFEHLLPIHVGAGAAGEDLGVRLWTLIQGSMGWAQYRFGEVSVAA